MNEKFDLLIRGGLIVDGRGGEPYEADIAVNDGRIAQIGRIMGSAREEISAKGLAVTPGFVDIHTHYDGQVTWAEHLAPSSSHGVTSVVIGNCGVGFAPCHAADHDRLIRLMEGVEDIPEVVLTEGVPWNWESFPEYLNSIARRRYDVDIAAYLPHSALRVYVMGQRGTDRAAATAEEIARMQELTREAVDAGALGFATSRTINHRASDGTPIATLDAAETELQAIASAVASTGRGVLQMVCDFYTDENIRNEFAMMRRIVASTGLPLSVSMSQLHENPEGWRLILQLLREANTAGLRIKGQVVPRPVGGFLGLELSLNPFSLCPSYQSLFALPLTQKLEALRDPAMRRRLLAEAPDPVSPFKGLARHFEEMYPMGDPPNYEPPAESSLGRQARARGVTPQALAYDFLTEGDGRNMLYVPLANYAWHSLEPSLEQMRHPDTVIGLGDAGAHLGMICDGSYPSFMLSYWVRDRKVGDRLSLPLAIKCLAHDTAQTVGLNDRGVLAPGYKADVNIIDLARIRPRTLEVKYDLPAKGRRLTQGAEGYAATIVSGVVVSREGKATGALPGRLVRGQTVAPQGIS